MLREVSARISEKTMKAERPRARKALMMNERRICGIG
jgi:hypothetical protein